ncbi:alpha-L-fucosidase [Xanthocytophaga agilis]|uniref:alpha-L-fucosidase n=1 Tax=Xanthocytophaga agilis TaxID=3048010 RepID=A0AAE3QXF9_9BACT|nr:alpha-L-fucosidase [Xanthocytophaga agilis]MDJ1499821.1 alpha-L-fucosidase [Xanthocytophaga agilis]
MRFFGLFGILLFVFCGITNAQITGANLNKPEREEWLKDAGFGMFIHWNMDVQLGLVISHSLVGASEDYIERYIHELPQTFNPTDWNAERMVIMAKNAGMKYIMFTTKHHAGFCMWDTKTTDFNIMHTPYQKDIVKQYVEACHKWGVAVGFYYSPEDFVFAYRNGMKDITRDDHWEKAKPFQEKYKAFVLEQCKELMTQYGQVDLFFIDSDVLREEVKQAIWKYQPNCLVTRGVLPTPEQQLPGETLTTAWESCMTMGTDWGYKPTNEHYKSGTELIDILIESRAKGGSYLLNVGPTQWGNVNEGQEGRLMEIGAWHFINQEAIHNVRPWIVKNEGDIWFTKKKDENTVYAYIRNMPEWPRGERRSFVLKSVKATAKTEISVLGQTGNVVEYQPSNNGKATFEQTSEGLKISVVRAQRIYNNHKWPNPIVVKLKNVEPALETAHFGTVKAEKQTNGNLKLTANLTALGNGKQFQLGFEYRPVQSTLNEEFNEKWTSTDVFPVTKKGMHSLEIVKSNIVSYDEIEYRAILYQDGLKIEGNVLKISKLKLE